MLDIESVKEEYESLSQQLSDPELISDFDERFEELSRKKKKLGEIIEKKKELEEIKNEIKENQAIISDPELAVLAQAELSQLQEKEKTINKKLESMLKENKLDPKYDSVIIEIRAGTGGNEAALFANDLFRMYSKYADRQNWTKNVLDSHPTELNGLKQIIFELKPARNASRSDAGGNGDVFSKIKHEAGVHRVQRIPETEKSGRIHTSTASVAVLPKPKTNEIKIRSDEIKVDVFRSSGPGGQNVNKRETAVRITHLATGIVVSSQTERNQLQNKENAMAILSARLLEKKQEEEDLKIGSNRKSQIGKAKRVEKIRTYNFPQDRVTDHRIKKSWHNIEKIMNGELDKMIEALQENL